MVYASCLVSFPFLYKLYILFVGFSRELAFVVALLFSTRAIYNLYIIISHNYVTPTRKKKFNLTVFYLYNTTFYPAIGGGPKHEFHTHSASSRSLSKGPLTRATGRATVTLRMQNKHICTIHSM